MSNPPIPAVFIAGTDTAVGKTRVAIGLLRALQKQGVVALGMKPVAAGTIELDGRRINEDVAMMAQITGRYDLLELMCPYSLSVACSPHIAAEIDAKSIDHGLIVRRFSELARQSQFMVVEGAGGWRAPISADQTMADVARALGLPIVLVVGLKLGCLNHAQLSAEAIRLDGAVLAGWIGSAVQEQFPFQAENLAALERLLGTPPLAVLPHAAGREGDVAQLAGAARELRHTCGALRSHTEQHS